MDNEPLLFSVSDFVAYANQTLEYAYPGLVIEGELANFRISKNRWVYFDLKDELASLRFFGTVYQLSGPLEDGMKLRVRGMPRIHPQYGFSITIQNIELDGEGTIKRAAALLEAKMAAEGLFNADRKRPLPYPPEKIGLITSSESAAYADFIKILKTRWPVVLVRLTDVQVQGVDAPTQIVQAISSLNQAPEPPEILVVIRGGGSPEDLQAFSDEAVVRAVAGSRIPTLVAIGHENDVSLAELAADLRASTPSNAAELLVPDQINVKQQLERHKLILVTQLQSLVSRQSQLLQEQKKYIRAAVEGYFAHAQHEVAAKRSLLIAYNPKSALARGYALIRLSDKVVRRGQELTENDRIEIELYDAHVTAQISKIKGKAIL